MERSFPITTGHQWVSRIIALSTVESIVKRISIEPTCEGFRLNILQHYHVLPSCTGEKRRSRSYLHPPHETGFILAIFVDMRLFKRSVSKENLMEMAIYPMAIPLPLNLIGIMAMNFVQIRSLSGLVLDLFAGALA